MANKKVKIEKLKAARTRHSTGSSVVKIKTETNGLGVLKTFFVALLILVQVALLLYLYIMYVVVFQGYLIFSFVMSLFTSIYVLSSNKNSQSKAMWILCLLVFFIFGYIIYFLSDERVFFRKAKKRYREIFQKSEEFKGKPTNLDNVSQAVKSDCNYLLNAGKFIAYTNTSTKYFSSGSLLFDDVLERLENAEKFIFIEYFIIADGVLLNRILDILERKAKSGVDIRIIYDDMGSHGTLSFKSKIRMKRSGIKIYPYNRLLPRFSVAINNRDHRKIIVIDGKTAYTGGCNLADEYINEKRMFGYWKDTGVRLDGSAVDGFVMIFLRQWEFITRVKQDYADYMNRYEKTENQSIVVPYADGLDYEMAIGKDVYINLIGQASKKLYIMTPYFILDDTIMNLLVNKALSGVDVRIILPGIPDKAYVYRVSRDNAEKLIRYGVKVYCMKNSFVHSKIMLTESAVVIGSFNMDLRSFYQQFESAIYTNERKTMTDVEDDFKSTCDNSELITNENQKRRILMNRIIAAIFHLFAPFM